MWASRPLKGELAFGQPNSQLAGARREGSVRRHRQGCGPAVLKVVKATSLASTAYRVGPL